MTWIKIQNPSRRLRNKIPTIEKLLKPEVQKITNQTSKKRQTKVERWYNENKKELKQLHKNQKIMFKKTPDKPFEQGTVVTELEKPRSYLVKDAEGNT